MAGVGQGGLTVGEGEVVEQGRVGSSSRRARSPSISAMVHHVGGVTAPGGS